MRLSQRQASMIDYPREGLDPHIWKYDEPREEYVLLPVVKNIIMSYVEKVCSYYKDCTPEKILIGSSIGSQFYNENTDFDIKIILDTHKLASDNNIQVPEGESLERVLKDQLDNIAEENDMKLDKHPFEFFFLDTDFFNDEQYLKRFDSLYDVEDDEWIRPAQLVDIDAYDRDSILAEGLDMARDWAEKWDLKLGEIKRHIKDFQLLADYIKELSSQHAEKMKSEVENILFKIEEEIRELAKEKKYVVNLRRESYADFLEKHEDYVGLINTLPEIIQMKLLAYWGYLSIIKELQKIAGEDEKISKHDIDEIEEAID